MKDWTAVDVGDDWKLGRGKMFENPPPVKLIARSGLIAMVDPTDVTNGQEAGKT